MAQNELIEDRKKVLTQFGKNLVVEAGAGTGKTSSLIKRIGIAILAKGKTVDKMVALTFTEKAAAEIKNRLVSALHQIICDIQAAQTQHVRPSEDSLLQLLEEHFSISHADLLARAQTALSQLDRASVGTIHGFCADILRTFPLEAGLSPQAEIDSGTKAARLFNRRWNAFLDEELGLEAPRAAEWKAVLPEISLEELKAFAQELCSGKIEQYAYFSHAAMIAAVCEEKAKQAQAWATEFLDPKKPTPRKIEQALLWACKTLQQSARFLRGEPETEPTVPLMPVLSAVLPNGWDEETYEAARGLVQFAFKMHPAKQRVFQQAFALVSPVVAEIRRDYTQAGVLSFDDLIVKTRNLVQQNLYVRRMLKEKFDLLFIDEFQDTDPVQGELLLFLAEEKSSAAVRWQDVKLEPGKLFVVGDPKQSIYRFRGADITAYELFTQLILTQGGKKCFLRNNYRSVPEIVATANAICRRAMVQQTAFQPAYEPIYPIKPARDKSVQWLFVRTPEQGRVSADDFRANQAEAVACWIKEHVGTMVLSSGKKLGYKDIAILSRAATTSGPYTDALRRHGIKFSADGEKDFFKRQEINDFLNFLRVIVDPTDTTALTGVLRSPLGGFSDEEIYQFVSRGELSVYAHPADESLARLYKQILSFVQQAGRRDTTLFVEEVLENTFLPELCAGAYEGEQTLEILARLTQGAQRLLGDHPATLSQFLAVVQEVLQTAPETLTTSPVDVVDAVSVMTVHKSKGLDFPVVILVDLSKKEAGAASGGSKHIFSWQYNMNGLRAGKICDANLAFLEEEQKKHERCEEIRILYVALTRAKEQLLLVGDDRKGAKKAVRVFEQAGLFPGEGKDLLLTDEVAVSVHYRSYEKPENFLYRSADVSQVQSLLPDLKRWRELDHARAVQYQKLLEEEYISPSARPQHGVDFPTSQPEAAEVGTLCHRALQLLLNQPEQTLAMALEKAVQTTGLNEREKEAAEILVPFCDSALFAELKQCKLLASEMPFSYMTSDSLVESGIMDAVFERPDGTVWVVDYKTDRVAAVDIAASLEKYRPQLTVYQQAAQQLFAPKRVRCSAVFVRAFAAADL